MKTTNNIQRTALIAAAACGLIILGFAVNAQFATISLVDNSETHHFAMATGNSYSNLKSSYASTTDYNMSHAFAAYLEEETEEPLQLEGWMTEESNFYAAFNLEEETENPLQIENWMTDEKTFDGKVFLMETETENPMDVEEWMLNDELFNDNKKEKQEVKAENNSSIISTKTFVYKEVNNEEKLRIEPWMINPNTWKN